MLLVLDIVVTFVSTQLYYTYSICVCIGSVNLDGCLPLVVYLLGVFHWSVSSVSSSFGHLIFKKLECYLYRIFESRTIGSNQFGELCECQSCTILVQRVGYPKIKFMSSIFYRAQTMCAIATGMWNKFGIPTSNRCLSAAGYHEVQFLEYFCFSRFTERNLPKFLVFDTTLFSDFSECMINILTQRLVIPECHIYLGEPFSTRVYDVSINWLSQIYSTQFHLGGLPQN